MFKLIAFSALFALATASGAFLPYSYYSYPASTSISTQSSSVVHPSPAYAYGAYYNKFPVYGHFIKKRSAPFNTYYAPSTYLTSPYSAYTYSAPLLSSPVLPTSPLHYTAPIATHLIKKRSAPLAAALPATYISPSYSYSASAPLLASTYSTPYFTSPYFAGTPYAYTPFIKK